MNPNHDPETGEFSEGHRVRNAIIGAGAGALLSGPVGVTTALLGGIAGGVIVGPAGAAIGGGIGAALGTPTAIATGAIIGFKSGAPDHDGSETSKIIHSKVKK